jgi:hypothetical protein
VTFSINSDLPPELYPLAWVVGTWKGEGTIGYPDIPESAISQEITLAVGGGPYLSYSASTSLVDKEGAVGQIWHQESGYWRVTPGQDRQDPPFEVEMFVADPAGVVTVYLGEANGPRIQVGSDAMVRSASAPQMDAATRMYGLVEGDLLWAWDLAAFGHPLGSYMASRLQRVEAE